MTIVIILFSILVGAMIVADVNELEGDAFSPR